VFLGQPPGDKPRHSGRVDIELLQWLDKLASEKSLNWLPFANGGDQRWQRQIAGNELSGRFAETRILDIRRERRKDGELFIHLYYPDSEETIGCEVFRNTLKLPSCPDLVNAISDGQTWQFQGIGAGHGLGLSILRAQALAEGGRSAEQILRDAYGGQE
jgi:peptidoglycan hydrolase-like amidase